MKPKRCGNCGSQNLKHTYVNDRPFPTRDYPGVFLYQKEKFWRCQNCREVLYSVQEGTHLSALLDEAITHQVNDYIARIMAREHCRQTEIAEHLGVSPEYLSEIKSGRKIPKFQTFNFLKTIAESADAFRLSAPAKAPRAV